MHEQQFDLHGKPVEPKKRAKHDPAEMSPEAEAALRPAPAWREPLMDMLDDIGIALDQFALRRFAEATRDVRDDYPVAWIDDLKKLVVERGVTNPEKVSTYLVASSKRWLAPGAQPVAEPAPRPEADTDERWYRYMTLGQTQMTVAAERARRHILAVEANDPSVEHLPNPFNRCTRALHLEIGCPLVHFGIYANKTITVPEETRELAERLVHKEFVYAESSQ